jgi:hypothetical protein
MAAAADSRFTLELKTRLQERALPTLLLWGEEDEFQPLRFAERYARDVANIRLERIPRARHIPQQTSPSSQENCLPAFLPIHLRSTGRPLDPCDKLFAASRESSRVRESGSLAESAARATIRKPDSGAVGSGLR